MTTKPTTMNNTLTDVPGVRVGQVTDLDGITGCTVIICPPGTIGGVDVRGGAPGTRETDVLQPHNRVSEVSAVVLAGGSAFGLAAADGVMRFLEEQGIGYRTAAGLVVPIVPAAILFDLAIGSPDARPTADMGYTAAESATAGPVQQGSVGAGTGARIAAMRGNSLATKGGIGSASVDLGDGLVVAALVAVNAVGDVLDEQGDILAGLRQSPDGEGFVSVLDILRENAHEMDLAPRRENTVLGVVATNAQLTKPQAQRVAQMAQAGVARAINPAHTPYDGDAMFALATGEKPANTTAIGAYAAEVVSDAIRNAVRYATTLGGVRAWND